MKNKFGVCFYNVYSESIENIFHKLKIFIKLCKC